MRSCVQLCQPFGFHGTLRFLAAAVGPFRDEAALLAALNVLEASREAWKVDVLRYAARRATAKRLGHRVPRADDPNPTPSRSGWYPDGRAAALDALKRWLDVRAPDGSPAANPTTDEVHSLLRVCITSGGPLSTGHSRRVRDLIHYLEREPPGLANSADLLTALRLVALADDVS
ncbi:hypothetical protein [Luedemannella flava]|uniref:hypothetical protein n=1 Tax=Luedemannella flava TaxID=349316 RepID=UPI0031D85DEC